MISEQARVSKTSSQRPRKVRSSPRPMCRRSPAFLGASTSNHVHPSTGQSELQAKGSRSSVASCDPFWPDSRRKLASTRSVIIVRPCCRPLNQQFAPLWGASFPLMCRTGCRRNRRSDPGSEDLEQGRCSQRRVRHTDPRRCFQLWLSSRPEHLPLRPYATSSLHLHLQAGWAASRCSGPRVRRPDL